MQKLVVLLLLAAVVAIATAATKEEMMAKKMAFKKGKGKGDHSKTNHLEEIQKLKKMNLSPEEFRNRMTKLKQGPAKKPAQKVQEKVDMQTVAHKRKVAEDRELAKRELEATEKQFRQEFAEVRGQSMNVREKQRKMVGMKQDFMAKVSDLKERMGMDTKKTDRMAWKQAQLKKRRSIIN